MAWEGFYYNLHHEHVLWALGNLSHSLVEIPQSFLFLSQTEHEGPTGTGTISGVRDMQRKMWCLHLRSSWPCQRPI